MTTFLCSLAQIIWGNILHWYIGQEYIFSAHGIYFLIYEQVKAIYTHKFNNSGLQYEVVIYITNGDIVWIKKTKHCSRWTGINIFKDSLVSNLKTEERVESGDGYFGYYHRIVKCTKIFCNPNETEVLNQQFRNSQETANKQFKHWGVIYHIYHHDINKHWYIFLGIAVISQLSINSGEILFDFGYHKTPYND